jgi:hypothetical protein
MPRSASPYFYARQAGRIVFRLEPSSEIVAGSAPGCDLGMMNAPAALCIFPAAIRQFCFYAALRATLPLQDKLEK